jgi:hypothetical protein
MKLRCNNFYFELQYIVLYLCVLIVFSLRRESHKLILVDKPLPEVILSHNLPPKGIGINFLRPKDCLIADHTGEKINSIKRKKNHGPLVSLSLHPRPRFVSLFGRVLAWKHEKPAKRFDFSKLPRNAASLAR